jgi:hypothetical protein
VEFDFLDVAGGTQYDRMHQAVFTVIDASSGDARESRAGNRPQRGRSVSFLRECRRKEVHLSR